jgi:regulator of protease activity HflC (stomatin/prohibitin superfamily)
VPFDPVTLSIIAFIAVVLLAVLYAAVKIVNQYERILIFTLGRTSPEEVK